MIMDLKLGRVRCAFNRHCDGYCCDAGINPELMSRLVWLNHLWNVSGEGEIIDQKSFIEEAHECLEPLFCGLPTWAAYLQACDDALYYLFS